MTYSLATPNSDISVLPDPMGPPFLVMRIIDGQHTIIVRLTPSQARGLGRGLTAEADSLDDEAIARARTAAARVEG